VNDSYKYKDWHHPNVVHILGIFYGQNDIGYIVIEFMSKGNLLDVMQKEEDILVDDMLKMARKIASGMIYLGKKKIVHGNLRLCNILVDEKYELKITDYAMRPQDEKKYIRGDGVKWSAPEAISGRHCSIMSDVWSCGVLFWELFTRGKVPFADFPNSVVLEKIGVGYRLPKPKECPDKMYTLMERCWEELPATRIHFRDLADEIDFVRKENSHRATFDMAEALNEDTKQPGLQRQVSRLYPPFVPKY